jgi:hypothetical protein
MEKRVIPNGKGGFINHIEFGNVEKIQFVDYLRELFIQTSMIREEGILLMNNPPVPMSFFQDMLRRKAETEWPTRYAEIKKVKIPDKLIELLNVESKMEQERALKQLDISNYELQAFYLYASEEKRLTFSRYTEQHIPSGFENAKFPQVYHLQEDGNIFKVGDTNLSDKQLRQIIEQRHVVIADILDNGTNWHCFYKTYRSLAGRENYKNGQPHLHYISNYWTIPRETIIREFKNRKQAFTSSIHIDYHTHRNPRQL